MKCFFYFIKELSVSCFLLVFIPVNAQQGCTDPQADNYDPAATLNDGSCTYPSTTLNVDLLSELEPTVSETSGLVRLSSGWWTHNDSGSMPELYEIDTTDFSIVRTVAISNASNIDWEEITVNNGSVFIGDFGNNQGSRQDLSVLTFSESELEDPNTTSITVDFINFSYPDQVNFIPRDTHSFDCEAFVSYQDSLHLFTKHRGNGFTKHYVVPEEPGTFTARYVDSLFVGGQVTASAIEGDSLIVLIGYTPPTFAPFMFLLWEFQNDNFFSGNKRFLNMGTVFDLGQQESIAFHQNLKGYITSEAVNPIGLQARIYQFSIDPFFSTLNVSENEINPRVDVFPNPTSGTFVVNVQHAQPNSKLRIFDATGRIVYALDAVKTINHIDLGTSIVLGIYTVQLVKKDGIISKKLVVNE